MATRTGGSDWLTSMRMPPMNKPTPRSNIPKPRDNRLSIALTSVTYFSCLWYIGHLRLLRDTEWRWGALETENRYTKRHAVVIGPRRHNLSAANAADGSQYDDSDIQNVLKLVCRE